MEDREGSGSGEDICCQPTCQPCIVMFPVEVHQVHDIDREHHCCHGDAEGPRVQDQQQEQLHLLHTTHKVGRLRANTMTQGHHLVHVYTYQCKLCSTKHRHGGSHQCFNKRSPT